MTNKIKKFLYILEHLNPDGRDEIPTFALYHPLLLLDAKLQVFGFNSILDMRKPLKVNIIDNGILDAIYLQWNSSHTYVK